MYSIFIVEDEPLIRENLRNQLLKLSETLPLFFSGEASDGEMGLSAIIDLQPDIILTDIKMPFMDGVTFATEVKKRFPWIRILFLTGFDDFNYMKTAIQIKADEYLLKPIKNNELERSLRRVVSELDSQKKVPSENESGDEKIVFELKKNHFLNGLFNGSLSMEEIQKKSTSLDRSLLGQKFLVLLVKSQNNPRFEEQYYFSNHLNYLFDDDSSLIFSSISSKYIKFLVFQKDREQLVKKSSELAQILIKELQSEQKQAVSVAIGPVVNRISDIPHSFHLTKSLLATYGDLKKVEIISYEETFKENHSASPNPFKLDLAKRIAALKPEEVNSFVSELSGFPAADETRNIFFRFFVLTELIKLVQQKNQTQLPPELEELTTIRDLSLTVSSMEEYTTVVRQICLFLIQSPQNSIMFKHQTIIQKAIDYIKENYSDPNISLNVVAEHVSLSPAHFSTIFSQAIGVTFIEYLTNCRIQLAKKLLTETNEKLSSIALEIGYNDPNYFSYLFKKKEKISPKEFRNHSFGD